MQDVKDAAAQAQARYDRAVAQEATCSETQRHEAEAEAETTNSFWDLQAAQARVRAL